VTTAEVKLFRETTRKFLTTRSPLSTVRELENDERAFDSDWWRAGTDLGWTRLLLPEAFGGGTISGSGVADLLVVAEELGRVAAAGVLTPVSILLAALTQDPEAGRHEELIEQLASGEAVGAWAVLEDPHHGLDVCATKVEHSGDSLVLTGTKRYVEAARIASHLLVEAELDGRRVQLLVPATAAGVRIESYASLDLGRRFATVVLDAVVLPSSALLGRAPRTISGSDYSRVLAAVVQSAESCGAADHAFELTIDFLGRRFSYGRALETYQALKHRVADMKMAIEASLAVTRKAALLLGADDPDAADFASAAKVYAGESATDVIQECIQLHGGIGLTWEHDLHLLLRRATVNRFTAGTPDEHRDRLALRALPHDKTKA
jgi:alkylation response protein AidB-like acyl-CoA dehydrogenase